MTSTPALPATARALAPRGQDDVVVELFHVELGGCVPCALALSEVDEAASLVRDELAARGRHLTVRTVALHEPGHAQALGIDDPVTVRVAGVDISPTGSDEHLTACGVAGAAPTSCRAYSWHGEVFDAPPAGLIVDAIHRHLGADAGLVPEQEPGGDPGLVEVLRRVVRGAVLGPADPGWGPSTSSFNLAFEQHPAAVVVPMDAEDVVAVVRLAAQRGVQVVPQRTGHNAVPLGDLAGTILLRTDGMTEVHLDAQRRLALVGSGATWADVVPAASDLGLAALHGSTPGVSVAGYSMGGGVGWYGRAHGLATNSVTGIEVVTPDGQLRWVDHEHDPELFWALRGGGGNFGVVTALAFQLYAVPQVHAGALFFPVDRSAEVLQAWLSWTRSAPESVTSVGRIISFPDEEGVPAPLRGGSYVVVEAVFTDSDAVAATQLEPLRRLGPVLDTFVTQPPAGIAELHMDPQDPLPYEADHLVLRDVTDEAIDDLVTAVGPRLGAGLISVEIRHLGGALSRDGEGHGALARMPGEYLLFGVGAAPTEAAADGVRAGLAAMTAPMAHLASGRYYNFSEHATDPSIHYPPQTYARLQRIRAQVDPGNVIRANHAIPARGAGRG